MAEFESYSFSRLYKDENIEFFFIIGVNDSDSFDDYWDGRLKEVIGYVMIFTNKNNRKQENFIYLIEKSSRRFEDIVRYTKRFVDQMSLSPNLSDRENFKISKTNRTGQFVDSPYTPFIQSIVRNDIPHQILESMTEATLFDK
ncbi:hypothetical protein [Planococcus sp. 4-30]|uniref:hypothetical protein n=1 Tax=Planococcus sp. 4-30 TaxID=2874583 RepID=UPI001CBF3585|nr:hypothetical protein [Planococcus sp. 4-30]